MFENEKSSSLSDLGEEKLVDFLPSLSRSLLLVLIFPMS